MEVNPYYLKDSQGNYYNQYPEFQIWEDGRKAGIKEVLVKLKLSPLKLLADNLDPSEVIIKITVNLEELQAFLKEWGVK